MYAHSAIPNPIYDTTEAFINLQVYCNENIWITNYSVTQNGNDFTIDAFYCYGWAQIVLTTNDSIPLGVLPAGNYTYTANIYSSYSPQTNCLSYVGSDIGSGTFTVLPLSATDIKEIEANIPELIKIIDLTGREVEPVPNTLLIYVYSDGTTEKVYRTK